MKIISVFLSIIKWLFVLFCVILAIGMPLCFGTALMIATAIIALPVQFMRNIWRSALHFTKRKTPLKLLIIALCFIAAVMLGIRAENTSTVVDTATPDIHQTQRFPNIFSGDDAASDNNEESDASTEAEKELPPFSIHYIDVDQAESALVQCDGHYMLIDGGKKDASSLLYTLLKNNGIHKLDIVVGTHAHEDHIGGIPGALNYATADLVLCPVTAYDTDEFANFARYAEARGGGIVVPDVGDVYALGSASVAILGVNSAEDPNNTSIILKITYDETTFLFTGDAEEAAEDVVLESGADLSSTVLQVGHHGSDTSTSYPFLREIMPQYAIISVGENNPYGHPTDNVLSRLRDADTVVYRTDLHGDIFLTSDGKTVTITTEKTTE